VASYPPAAPRSAGKKFLGIGLFGLAIPLVIGGFFIYNMLPNLVSLVVPGGTSGVGGEWVGLVKVQNDMMDSNKRLAAVRLTMHPTAMFSIIPTYSLTGEMTEEGHATPITFSSSKVYTGHSIISLSGSIDESSDSNLKEGMINGDLKGQKLSFKVNAMAAGSTLNLEGELQKGTDDTYAALSKQVR
jgi:hypothetical protein